MLVTLEGIDGSGKTSAWEALRDADLGRETTFTREPTDSWYGEAVARSIGDDDADSLAELFLYTADHAAHLSSVIRPALERGDMVISDRYSDSRYAYQGATLSEHSQLEDALAFVQEIHEPWTRPPDLTLYLDVDPEVGARRAGATNKFEQADYLRRVADNYERLIDTDPERFVRIDAEQPQDAVQRDVLDAIRARY
jgi:dTMP kinase